jgi:Zn-dependent peptidase ImmA (M78 family)
VREEEAKRLQEHKSFVKLFPYKEMVKRGWLPQGTSTLEKLRHLLNFFGVVDPGAWETHWGNGQLAAFRKTNAKGASEYPTAAWLRAGELAAQNRVSAPYDRKKFQKALEEIRSFIPAPPPHFSERIMELCAEAGVASVLMPQLPKTGIAGATRWIHKTPIIQLSIRNKYEDYFWFTLFHEAAHVLLHGKTDVFWSGLETDGNTLQEKEDEANEWASNFLIPSETWQSFVDENTNFYKETICDFARQVPTAPGIVVGRLQHEGRLSFKFQNKLRRKLNWAE